MTSELEVLVAFPATYSVDVLADLPSARIDRYSIHRPSDPAGADLLLEVATEAGGWWVAEIRKPPPMVARSTTGVFSTPLGASMCVVAAGDAFLIDVDHPADFEWFGAATPIVEVRALVEAGLLLLATPWTVTALGRSGMQWQSDRLAIDGFRLDEVADGWIAGVADHQDEEPRDFAIDLSTGRHVGGTSAPFG